MKRQIAVMMKTWRIAMKTRADDEGGNAGPKIEIVRVIYGVRGGSYVGETHGMLNHKNRCGI